MQTLELTIKPEGEGAGELREDKRKTPVVTYLNGITPVINITF